jgi:hypothetical protein
LKARINILSKRRETLDSIKLLTIQIVPVKTLTIKLLAALIYGATAFSITIKNAKLSISSSSA